jgi:hypothetical protein
MARSFWTGLAAAVALAASTAPPSFADAALWAVRSPTATVYLFGTVHALHSDTKWRNPKFDRAFRESKEIYFEVDGQIADERRTFQMIREIGIDIYHPLFTVLPKKDADLVDATARSAKLGELGEIIEFLRPWFGATLLDAAGSKRFSYDGNGGVEPLLLADARTVGKPIKGMESFDDHYECLEKLPRKAELALLKLTAREFESASETNDAQLSDWLKGDIDAIATWEDGLKTSAPEAYEVLFPRRNKAWADEIVTMLKDRKIVMIAVDAAHLAGPDGVQHQLEAQGVTAVRL